MLRPCALCVHDRHEEVDAAILNNEPFQTIAKRFGTSMVTVLSHRNHLQGVTGPAAGPGAEPRDIVRAYAALNQMKTLERSCATLLQVAEGASELRVVFSAISQVQKHLETLAELTSELDAVLRAQG